MVEFFEPENEFKFEKERKKNIRTRIRTLTLLIIFLLILGLAVQCDFAVSLGKKKIEEKCDFDNRYNRNDDAEITLEKAEKAFTDNQKLFESLEGFIEAEIIIEEKKPQFNLIFEKNYSKKIKVPEKICGFKTVINEK